MPSKQSLAAAEQPLPRGHLCKPLALSRCRTVGVEEGKTMQKGITIGVVVLLLALLAPQGWAHGLGGFGGGLR